jgi:hypothetical protein
LSLIRIEYQLTVFSLRFPRLQHCDRSGAKPDQHDLETSPAFSLIIHDDNIGNPLARHHPNVHPRGNGRNGLKSGGGRNPAAAVSDETIAMCG